MGRHRRRSRLTRRLVAVERQGATTVVTSEFATATGIAVAHEARYTALGDGGIAVEETAEIPDELDDLARVGTVMELDAELEDFEWFGTGPHETYPDRRRSGLVGRWTSSVTDQLVPYIRPQRERRSCRRPLVLASERRRWPACVSDLDEPRQVSATHARAADLDVGDPRRGPRHVPADDRRDRCRPTAAWAPRAVARTRSPSTSSTPAGTRGADAPIVD